MNKNILEEIKRFKEILKESELNVLSSPLDGPLVVTSPFGEKRDYETHPGVDLAAAERKNVMSPFDGVVSVASMNHDEKCGGTIIIKHSNGFRSGFCHMSKIDVSVGDKVIQGQVLGLSGGDKNDPGKGNSRGRHLHWTLRKDGELVDPMKYVNQDIKPSGKPSTNVSSEEESLLDKILNTDYEGKKIKDLIDTENKKLSMVDYFKNFYEVLSKML